ncbi:MAG: endo-1,4-beta-xylanase [bacterium]|nr:endo-1,4-beta-xylanase [bacterium]
MLARLTALALLALVPSGHAAPAPCSLGDLAARAGVEIGAAFVEGSDQPAFRALLGQEFGSTTMGVYWSAVQPQPGVFNFASSDTAMAEATARGLRVRGHPLVWGRLALPAWVNAITDPAVMRTVMHTHIETLVGRYAGRVAQWDVVNEPLTFFGTPGTTDGLEPYVFQRLLGPGYIEEALRVAHAADPQAKLFVNELLAFAPGPKQERFFRLVQDLLAAGAPLHGVGFQGHITPPYAPAYRPTRAEMEATIARFAALGLAVEITELDVSLPAPHTPCALARQGETYRDVMAACLAVPACTGVTVWGMGDGFSWIRSVLNYDGAPLPFDAAWQPKPAYRGLARALFAAAGAPADCSVADRGDRIDLAGCVCETPVPAGCGTALPVQLAGNVAKACGLIADARAGGDPAARRQLTRAASQLGRAGRTVRKLARKRFLEPSCAEPLAATVAEGRARARAARR